jgi:tetratricopeptide (TPR) repeat protein
MKRKILYCLLISANLLAACSVTPKRTTTPDSRSTPAPVTSQRPEVDEEPQVRAYEPAAQVRATPTHGRAVVALLQSAEKQEAADDLAGAVGTVERALRIEPRNAHLWNRLANLRLQQGTYGMAADLAAKSNNLAGGDLALKRDNWRLIAQARRAAGDIAGARVAERKARTID